MESVEEVVAPGPETEGPRCRTFHPLRLAAMQELEQKVLALTAACSQLEQYKQISKEIEVFIAAKRDLLPSEFLQTVYYRRLDHIGFSIDFLRLYDRLLGTPIQSPADLRRRANRLEKYVQGHKAMLSPDLLAQYNPYQLIESARRILPEPETPPQKRGSVGYRSFDHRR